MYIDGSRGVPEFRRVRAPSDRELTQLVHTIAHRVAHFLERQGLQEADAENSYLAENAVDENPLNPLRGASITYRIAVGPQAGRKVFTLQTLPAWEEDSFDADVGKAAGFSLHAVMIVLRYSWLVESIASTAHAYQFEGNLEQLFGRRARDPACGPC